TICSEVDLSNGRPRVERSTSASSSLAVARWVGPGGRGRLDIERGEAAQFRYLNHISVLSHGRAPPMRKTKASLALTLGAVLALTACAPSATDPEPSAPGTTGASQSDESEPTGDPVKVGVITSTTGPLAAYGEAYVQGLEAGFDYATDGTMVVNGSEIELT